MTLAERLDAATAMLAAAGIDQPRREARLLLSHATGLDPASLLRDMAACHDVPGLDALIARRAGREPLALITGHQPFWTLDLAVGPATLIPRADSEALVEAALAAFPNRAAVRRVLDLGTGTGCLLLAGLSEFPLAWGVGVDRVPGAAALARRNAAANGLASRCGLVCGDWAAPLAGRFDLVFGNPPYIATPELAGLMPEVARFEPASALDGGPDGLDAYRAILPALPGLLAPGGAAVLELGEGQGDRVAALAVAGGLLVGGLHGDLAGIGRALTLRHAR